MLLKEISINNFRGIREGTLSDLTQVNILVGRNNTGKSSVLEALCYSGFVTASGGTDILRRNLYDYLLSRRVQRTGLNSSELSYGMKEAKSIQIGIVFEDGVTLRVEGQSLVRPHQERDNNARQWIGRVLIVDPATVRDFGKFETGLWEDIKRDRKDRVIIEVVKNAYDMEIDNIGFGSFGGTYKLALETRERTVPIDVVGDGLRQGIAILSAAVVMNDSPLALEEPETHQHPESLRRLLLALFSMAKRNDIQLFISTHSLELISYALQAAEKEHLDLKVYHLTHTEDGILKARGISAPDAKVFADMGPDPRTLHKYVSA